MHWERMAFAALTAASAIGLVCIKLPKWILYEVWVYWERLLLSSEREGQIGWNIWNQLLLIRVLIPEIVLLVLVKRKKKSGLKFLFLLELQASSLLAVLLFAAVGLHKSYKVLAIHMIYNISYLMSVTLCIWLCESPVIGRNMLPKRIFPYLSGLILLAGLVMESILLI